MFAGSVIVQQRDALATPTVCDWHVASAHERLQGTLRQQRTSDVHHREVGHSRQLP